DVAAATDTTYDAAGEVRAVTAPGGAVTRYAYDRLGRGVSTTEAAGPTAESTTWRGYGAAGNPVWDTDPRWLATRCGASPRGRPTSRALLLDGGVEEQWTTTYDAAGHVTAESDPLGETTTTAYDAVGRPVLVTDPLGRSTATAYDPAGEVVSTTDALGHVTL